MNADYLLDRKKGTNIDNAFTLALKKATAKEAAKKTSVKKAQPVAPSLSLAEPAAEPSPLSLAMPDPLELTPRLQGRRFLETPSRAGSRPGDTKINQLDLSQGMTTGKSRNSYMDGPEYDALVQAAMGAAPNRALSRGIDEQQAFYEATAKGMPRGQVDLTPLMAMTDAMTGSNFAGSYKAPEGFSDRAKLLSGLQDKTQGSRERLAQLLMNETGGLKNGQDEQGYKSGMDESQKNGFAHPNPHAPRMGQQGNTPTNVRGFYNTFKGSEPVKEAAKIQQAAQAITGHLKNPNWLGDSAARAGILQAMRLAPVSNLDVKQITGSQDLFNQANQLMNRIGNGDVFTARDRRTIEDYNKYLLKKSKLSLEFARDSYAKTHSPFYGFDYDTGKGLLESALPSMDDGPAEEAPKKSMFQQLMEKEVAK